MKGWIKKGLHFYATGYILALLENDLNRQAERRSIMKKKSIALLLVFAMAVSMLAGCSKSGKKDGDSVELTVGLGAQFTTLDPGLNTETVNSYVLAHTVATLFDKDDDGVLQNDLADGYEVSEDGLTYTVTLKDGLKWSDGEDLTAEDFVYAVKRNLTYGAENAWATNDLVKYIEGAADYANNSDLEASDLTDFTGVEALDEKTIVYHLIKPCAFFPTILASYVFAPLREDFIEPHGSEWAFEGGYPSCGAYILEECNENEKAVVVKNDNYYDAENITVDKITFMVMTDQDAQEAAFKTGKLDAALGVKTTVIDSYEVPEDVWKIPSVSVYFIVLNSGETGPEELKDVNIRRALAISLDKAAMSEVLGDLYPPINGYVPSGMQGATKDFREEGDEKEKFLEYDLDEAKKLLAEAGYDESNPLHLTYKYSDSSLHADIAQLLQEQWKKAGIVVDLEVVESGVFYDQIDNGDFQMSRYGYMGSTDPSAYLDLWTKGMQIVPAVDDDAYDQMLDDASWIVDPTEYYEALHEAERYLVQEQVYIIPLFDYGSVALLDHTIGNVTCAPGSVPFYGYATFEAEE